MSTNKAVWEFSSGDAVYQVRAFVSGVVLEKWRDDGSNVLRLSFPFDDALIVGGFLKEAARFAEKETAKARNRGADSSVAAGGKRHTSRASRTRSRFPSFPSGGRWRRRTRSLARRGYRKGAK